MITKGPFQPRPSCVSVSPAPWQVALATYSYRSLPWLLLNRSSDLPAVLERIRTVRYEEPSGNAIGEGLRGELGQRLGDPMLILLLLLPPQVLPSPSPGPTC